MAARKWSDSTIEQAAGIAADDQFLIIQDSSGQSKRITQGAILSSSGNNLKTIAYIIGVAGTADCDYNFTSVANTTKQSIQLGATTIIPVYSPIIITSVLCELGLNGIITGTVDLGTTSGGTEIASGLVVDDTGEVSSTSAVPRTTATSVYFSFSPSANWNTITTGKWQIWISYIDNSII